MLSNNSRTKRTTLHSFSPFRKTIRPTHSPHSPPSNCCFRSSWLVAVRGPLDVDGDGEGRRLARLGRRRRAQHKRRRRYRDRNGGRRRRIGRPRRQVARRRGRPCSLLRGRRSGFAARRRRRRRYRRISLQQCSTAQLAGWRCQLGPWRRQPWAVAWRRRPGREPRGRRPRGRRRRVVVDPRGGVLEPVKLLLVRSAQRARDGGQDRRLGREGPVKVADIELAKLRTFTQHEGFINVQQRSATFSNVQQRSATFSNAARRVQQTQDQGLVERHRPRAVSRNTYHGGPIRRRDLAAEQLVPVDRSEEDVALDVLGVAVAAAKT